MVSVECWGLRCALKGFLRKTELGRPGQDPGYDCLIKRWSTSQDPGVSASRFADQYPLVIGIEHQDPVIAIKWSEKTDTQPGIVAARHRFCLSFSLRDSAIDPPAAIGHLYSLAIQLISGLCITCADRLKPVGKPGYFIPGAHVASQIDRLDGR